MASFNSITRKKQGGGRKEREAFSPRETRGGGGEGRAFLGKRTSQEFVEPANAVDVEEIGRNHQSARPLISRSCTEPAKSEASPFSSGRSGRILVQIRLLWKEKSSAAHILLNDSENDHGECLAN